MYITLYYTGLVFIQDVTQDSAGGLKRVIWFRRTVALYVSFIKCDLTTFDYFYTGDFL